MTDGQQWQFPQARIVVFAKAPRSGQVKTRLATALGADEAARVYAGWLETTVTGLTEARLAPLELWVTPDAGHPLFQRLAAASGAELHVQPGGNLGQRMHQVMLHCLAWNESAVLIGSDCPMMQPGYVRRALAAMEAGIDTVLGPTEDGGYVLLGLRKVMATLFTDMPWSTSGVLQATRRRLRAAGESWAELETLWDIDSLQDYERWQARQSAVAVRRQSGSSKEVNVS
jgi:rSAM/selenodomain-associated transferase 1